MAARITSRAGEDAVVINEIPLLFETQGQSRFDLVITVESKDENRKSRLLSRGLKGYEIDRRIAAQASRAERVSIADIVIENDGDTESLESEVLRIWESEIKPRLVK